ncbi:MAG: transglycosylase domain-containing protein [Armatimonadetes bacterium]|nr:transglycosylase domain-containing protein [Armatimonadota bacterium]
MSRDRPQPDPPRADAGTATRHGPSRQRHIGRTVGVGATAAGVIWQAGAWALWPIDAPFPYTALVPLLGVTITTGCVLRLVRPQRQSGRACRSRRARRPLTLIVLAVVAAAGCGGAYAVVRRRVLACRDAVAGPGWVQLSEVSAPMLDSIVASEDRHYYRHSGVDWVALHRAIRFNIQAGSFRRGGSTITMQATRCEFLTRDRTVWRKLCEVPLALCVDHLLTKEEVLVLYLGHTDFGLGAMGVRDAARTYFGKKAINLTLSEAAFLASLPPRPPRAVPEVTHRLVDACRSRALARLRRYRPSRYSEAELERARLAELTFAWERNDARPAND